VLAVGCGGFAGAILRYLLGEWLKSKHPFPIGTFVINVLGCFFLAWFLTYTSSKLRKEVTLLIGTGFTGAFTTFSTFSVETVQLLNGYQFVTAASYIMLSIVSGMLLSYFGYHLAIFMREKGATR
jgi:fluoride exporter